MFLRLLGKQFNESQIDEFVRRDHTEAVNEALTGSRFLSNLTYRDNNNM